jgi:hypothetical protein
LEASWTAVFYIFCNKVQSRVRSVSRIWTSGVPAGAHPPSSWPEDGVFELIGTQAFQIRPRSHVEGGDTPLGPQNANRRFLDMGRKNP